MVAKKPKIVLKIICIHCSLEISNPKGWVASYMRFNSPTAIWFVTRSGT